MDGRGELTAGGENVVLVVGVAGAYASCGGSLWIIVASGMESPLATNAGGAPGLRAPNIKLDERVLIDPSQQSRSQARGETIRAEELRNSKRSARPRMDSLVWN